MREKFRRGARWLFSVPGHSLLILVLAIGLFGASGFAPSALAWGLRSLGLLALVVLAVLLCRDLPQIAGWLVSGPLALYQQGCQRLKPHREWLRRYEVLLATAILLVSAFHFSQSVGAMARASLRVDEVGSVRSYTSRGPLTSATKYSLAKNHIFFSLVNSLTPGSGSLHPARARLWSFVSVGLALGIFGVYFWRLGSPLAGALAIALPALNLDLLTKVFEARGYGFLTLATACGLTAIDAFLRTSQRRFLWVLGVSVALGTWTLPFYVVFGGGLMLLLFLVRPSRVTLIAGLASAIAIIGLYAPVLLQLAQVAGGYDEKYGEEFSSLGSVMSAMSYAVPSALLRVDDVGFLGLVLMVILVPLVLPGSRSAHNKALQLGAAAVLGFYLFCLILATTPQRITAFLAMPVAFVAAMLAFQILTYRPLAGLRPLLATLVAAVILPIGIKAVLGFSFEPDQRWREAALTAQTIYPDGAEIFIPGYRNTLAEHLDGRYLVRAHLPSPDDLPGGPYLIFDPAHKSTHVPLDLASKYPQTRFYPVRFPLLGSAEQVLYVPVAEELRIPAVGPESAPLPLPVPASGDLLIPLPSPVPRAVFILADAPVERWIVAAKTLARGSTTELTSRRIQKAGNLIALDLNAITSPDSLSLQIVAPQCSSEPKIQAIWFQPAPPPGGRN